jgi:hypothetical protein
MTWREYTLPVVNDIRRTGGGILLLRCGTFTEMNAMEDACHSALCTVAVGTNCYC